jgi:hypothetical protein
MRLGLQTNLLAIRWTIFCVISVFSVAILCVLCVNFPKAQSKMSASCKHIDGQ